MKSETRICVLVACAGLLCGVCFAGPTLQVGSPTLAPGGTGVLTMSVSGGEEPFAGVNARLVLPPKIHCDGVQAGPALSGGFILDHAVAGDPEVVTVVAYSGAQTFTNGEALRLQLRADADAALGPVPGTFADAKADVVVNAKWALSNATGETSIRDIIPTGGTVTVSTVIEGEPPVEASRLWKGKSR